MRKLRVPTKALAAAMSRLALGTVQFGLNYGVANDGGQVGAAEAAAILTRATAAGVDILDTAIAYGASETCLGSYGVSSWRVISKLPPLPIEVSNVSQWVVDQVGGSLQRLRIEKLEAVLLHRPSDLLGRDGREYQHALAELRERGHVAAVGVSIYDPSELDALWPVWRPDLVQAPFNVLDRRIVHSGWSKRLVREGCRLHVRSVFLQGLLLMSAARRPAWFARWQQLFDRWSDWCRSTGTTPLAAAIGFVAAQPDVECHVVGVDSPAQLDEVLAARTDSAAQVPEDLWSADLELLEPSRWKLG